MTQHLWSGRFDAAPDPAAFDFGVSFPFDRRLFEDDVTGSLAWAEGLVACGALSAEDGATDSRRVCRRFSTRAGSDPDVGRRRRRRRAQLRRAAARRGDWGRGTTPAHRAIAKRAGLGRSSTLPAAPDSALCSRQLASLVATLADQAERAGDALDAVVHAHAARHAGDGRAFPPEPRRGPSTRSRCGWRRRPRRPTRCRSAPARSRAPAIAIDVHALAARLGFSRVVLNSMDASSDRDFAASFVYACTLADGSPEPHG